jgi:Tfp pilus assembly protein PilF
MNGLPLHRRLSTRSWLSFATRRSALPLAITLGIALSPLCLIGCASRSASPYATPSERDRDPMKANELTRKAADLIESDPERAERLLREALAADLYSGPAHNNLGVIHLKRGDLYEAANEFEWARKLMPEQPDPRTNLALTLETAGRQIEALQSYAAALQIRPEHMPTMQALARIQIRLDKTDAKTHELLSEIALRGTTPRWRDWAREQALKVPTNDLVK